LAKKPIIGILGGIASGKSSVAAAFAKLGCAVIDADDIAHDLLNDSHVKSQVINEFGTAVLDSTDRVNRSKLGDIVFADESKLTMLNEILHPLITQRAEQLIGQYEKIENIKAIVLDAPLLVEVGWDKKCDKLVFVACGLEKRLKRAQKKGISNENQLKMREKFQISLDSKASLVDNTIDNNSSLSALAEQVAKIFSSIMCDG